METLSLLYWIFDVMLVLGLLWLAERTLASDDLFRGCVLFIAFGLLMTLAWVRLDAPDVALAEAGIGAGLTGALLLAAEARLHLLCPDDRNPVNITWRQRWYAAPLVLPVALGVGYAVISLPVPAPGLVDTVDAHLQASGVGNPVTAVLLNFRGYDTLLEMIVLLLALLGVWSLSSETNRPSAAEDFMLGGMMRLLAPLFILVAGYLLWVGADAPGGAFQAGSVLAALGVLAALHGWRPTATNLDLLPRVVLTVGSLVFLFVAIICLVLERGLLTYPMGAAGIWILLIETFATLSIGATLAALFVSLIDEKRS